MARQCEDREAAAAEAQKRGNGPGNDGVPPRIPKLAANRTFRGDGLTDAI
jgi:hypothetical protein